MKEGAHRDLALRAALIGLIGLAAAMGIGRFAFTPMLPLMQVYDSVSLPQGSYLASANYLGYLLGALLSFALNPRAANAAKLGLAAVAVSTLAMAFTSSFLAWLMLRLIAGVGSAFVLVGISAWAMAALAAHQRSTWSGWVFAGVGAGILFAGLAVLVIGMMGIAPALGWLLLGGAASLVALSAARSITDTTPSVAALQAATPSVLDHTAWRLIVCYGAFGFGYIIPATFLPAAARALINDPTVFGWTWPVFGLAAATSTVVAATVLRDFSPRRLWAFGQVIMAAGVALPAIQMTLLSMIVSAVCVGGTFMVITMAGMQEARRIGGQSASRLMAAMTAAFATGQLAGPLTVTAADSAAQAIRGPSLLAAALLFFTALALLPGSKTTAQQDSTTSTTRSRT
jgi:predicted MFS family arabinose efflux permease